jgi:hypothetical protein
MDTPLATTAAIVFGLWFGINVWYACRLPILHPLLRCVNVFRLLGTWGMFRTPGDHVLVLEYRDEALGSWRPATSTRYWTPLSFVFSRQRALCYHLYFSGRQVRADLAGPGDPAAARRLQRLEDNLRCHPALRRLPAAPHRAIRLVTAVGAGHPSRRDVLWSSGERTSA